VLIPTRDLDVIAFVARFGQVTRKQIRAAVFTENKSDTPCDRTVKRLVDKRLLAIVEQATPGGRRGGRGQDVLQIGPTGWKVAATEGSFWLSRSVKLHSLAITDVYVDISSRLNVIRFECEPDSHEKINYVPIQPDLYVELDLGQHVLRTWLEVDLGSERPKQLKDKMSRYYHAWSGAPDKWRPWPLVVWVVPDEKRRAEIESLIRLEPAESQAMYRVTLFENVVPTLLNG
jgi:hypothetical protein